MERVLAYLCVRVSVSEERGGKLAVGKRERRGKSAGQSGQSALYMWGGRGEDEDE